MKRKATQVKPENCPCGKFPGMGEWEFKQTNRMCSMECTCREYVVGVFKPIGVPARPFIVRHWNKLMEQVRSEAQSEGRPR